MNTVQDAQKTLSPIDITLKVAKQYADLVSKRKNMLPVSAEEIMKLSAQQKFHIFQLFSPAKNYPKNESSTLPEIELRGFQIKETYERIYAEIGTLLASKALPEILQKLTENTPKALARIAVTSNPKLSNIFSKASGGEIKKFIDLSYIKAGEDRPKKLLEKHVVFFS